MSTLTIVMYHYVRDIKNSDYPRIKGLEFDGFKRQLDYLSENFSIVRAEDVLGCLRGDAPLHEGACLLTFDDGYKDHFTYVFPELQKRNIQGSFFPPVRPVVERDLLDVNRIHFILASTDDYSALVRDVDGLCVDAGMTSNELSMLKTQYATVSRYDGAEVIYIKRMLQHVLPEHIRSAISSALFRKYVQRSESEFANDLYFSLEETKILVENGMYVGSHGYRHLWLDREPVESQCTEIDLSLKFLNDVGANTEDWMMCYPYGAYNDDTLRILRARRCAAGLTTKVGLAEVSHDFALEMSRYDTNDFPQ
jgi:peptidoglycan/xylan/chitin deacetylase (PgdA/CDA1 family)